MRCSAIGLYLLCAASGLFLAACDRDHDAPVKTSATTRPREVLKAKLTLDWKPEPEFGGFYAAQQIKAFEQNGLDIEIKPAGPGAPSWQLVATGRTEFATTAADQVLVARSQGADVVAIFATYQ